MQYIDVYKNGVQTLKDAGVAEAELDARLLLEYVCKTDRNTLYSHPEKEVLEDEYKAFLQLLLRRKNREPLQHLTGVTDFMGLEFQVNENVLIPRQDTEILVEEALKVRMDGDRILDMCTGSGCILTSILYYSNDCKGVGVDKSRDALKVAVLNSDRLLSEKTDDTEIYFINSDLFDEVNDSFDIIVSNPPYIPTADIESLMPEVRKYEPLMALDGKNDGLWFYERIVERLNEFLKPGGWILFEIGCEQGKDVSKLLLDAGFNNIEVIKDYAGLDRVVKAVRPIMN